MQVLTEGVYFLYDGDELVYIGTTDNLYRRIGEHIAAGEKVFDRFEFYPTEDRIRLEGFLIDLFNPKYNVAVGADWNHYKSVTRDFFPNQTVQEAIKKYDEYMGDPFVDDIADRIGTYRDALLRGLRQAKAPIYILHDGGYKDGYFRLDKDWYEEHKDKMWDYVS